MAFVVLVNQVNLEKQFEEEINGASGFSYSRRSKSIWNSLCSEIKQNIEHATARLTSGHIGNQI